MSPPAVSSVTTACMGSSKQVDRCCSSSTSKQWTENCVTGNRNTKTFRTIGEADMGTSHQGTSNKQLKKRVDMCWGVVCFWVLVVLLFHFVFGGWGGGWGYFRIVLFYKVSVGYPVFELQPNESCDGLVHFAFVLQEGEGTHASGVSTRLLSDERMSLPSILRFLRNAPKACLGHVQHPAGHSQQLLQLGLTTRWVLVLSVGPQKTCGCPASFPLKPSKRQTHNYTRGSSV